MHARPPSRRTCAEKRTTNSNLLSAQPKIRSGMRRVDLTPISTGPGWPSCPSLFPRLIRASPHAVSVPPSFTASTALHLLHSPLCSSLCFQARTSQAGKHGSWHGHLITLLYQALFSSFWGRHARNGRTSALVVVTPRVNRWSRAQQLADRAKTCTHGLKADASKSAVPPVYVLRQWRWRLAIKFKRPRERTVLPCRIHVGWAVASWEG